MPGADILDDAADGVPDIALYHSRQVVVLGPNAWDAWLTGETAEAVLRPSPAGSLHVERA